MFALPEQRYPAMIIIPARMIAASLRQAAFIRPTMNCAMTATCVLKMISARRACVWEGLRSKAWRAVPRISLFAHQRDIANYRGIVRLARVLVELPGQPLLEQRLPELQPPEPRPRERLPLAQRQQEQLRLELRLLGQPLLVRRRVELPGQRVQRQQGRLPREQQRLEQRQQGRQRAELPGQQEQRLPEQRRLAQPLQAQRRVELPVEMVWLTLEKNVIPQARLAQFPEIKGHVPATAFAALT